MRDIYGDDHRGLYLLCATILVALIVGAAVIMNMLVWNTPPVHVGFGYGV